MSIIIPIIAIVVVLAGAFGIIASRYKIAGPTEAMIITGRSKQKGHDSSEDGALSGQRVVIGGGAMVLPLIQSYQKISLESQTISVSITGVPAHDGILLDVDGVAVVKVNGTESSVRAAAQRFGNDHARIGQQAQKTLAGALRSVVGQMNVTEIISDRKAFASKVIESVKDVIDEQGLQLDTFQIEKVDDRDGFLQNLGRPQAARVLKDAEVAEAEATRESEQKKIEVAQTIADAERKLSIRRSEIQAETERISAEAQAAKPLEVAAQEQKILIEKEKVEANRAILTERELEVQIRRPADAARYRVEQEAEARKSSTIADADAARQKEIAEAEAAAQTARLRGEGNLSIATAEAASNKQKAEGNLALAQAEATATRLRGEAEAAAILAKGESEAAAMQKKADAFKEYGSAAILETIVSTLPAIAHEFAAPMANIKDLTVISTEGANSLTKGVANNMTSLNGILDSLTGGGFSLNGLLENIANGTDLKSNDDVHTITDVHSLEK